VLVVKVEGAPPPPRRRIGRAKPKDAEPGSPPSVPVTTLTAIRPDDLGDEASAGAWLAQLRDDPDALAAEVDDAVVLINRAVHAHRAAALDPQIADVTPGAALVVRVGFGDGEQLAEGEFAAAVEVPYAERRRRAELLRPQERVAEVLGGKVTVPACELLVIRARADVDAGRRREAALQLRPAVDAMLAERDALAAPDQEADFAALEERREAAAKLADAAVAGALSDDQAAEAVATLRIAERVLRRKRALG
jgi:hypothetical protein